MTRYKRTKKKLEPPKTYCPHIGDSSGAAMDSIEGLDYIGGGIYHCPKCNCNKWKVVRKMITSPVPKEGKIV